MDETCLYHYDPETKEQSIEWRHSGSPRPKIFRVQKSAGKFLALIFWDQASILLVDYLPKGQSIDAEDYSSLLLQLNDILKENAAGRWPRFLFLAGQYPGSPGTCNPKETDLPGFLISWSPNLLSGSGPVGLPPVPWTEKQLIDRHFRTTRRHDWTDNILNFFLVASKFKATD